MIKIFYDTEATGTKFWKHSLHQVSGLIEVDGEVVEEFDFCVRPHPNAKIEPSALVVGKVTLETIMDYPEMGAVLSQFTALMDKYIDRFDRADKAYLIGFNNSSFDDRFLRAWFELCHNRFFDAYFWTSSIDTMVLAAEYLKHRRPMMPSFKLHRVAMELGIDVDPNKRHEALYDALLTREVYRRVTGIQDELF